MKNIKTLLAIGFILITTVSCKKLLDRPPLTSYEDNPGQFWRNENDVRMFATGFYTQYFVGYNTGFGLNYTPLRGYTFNDDVTSNNVQANFETAVPSSRGSLLETAAWLQQYAGPTWDFAWVRKANIFIDRLDQEGKKNLTEEAFNHWDAVAHFFRGFEYSRLVRVFGDVPYFGRQIQDDELDTLYKDRDPRGIVMDKVYDDFKYALANMRENDGPQTLNKYVAAAFVSRLMLFEGSYLHYHNLDNERAQKYLEFARDAAEIVMNSNNYSFGSDFKSLFASQSLAGNPEVLMYREYSSSLTVMHSIGSYSNGTERVGVDANLDLAKSFIMNDGKVWENSGIATAADFSIKNLTLTRDPRFEATFMDIPNINATTLLYGYKFASRDAITFIGKTYPPEWGSSTNTNDAPVIRLAEVVLNWIEAKAILAENYGGSAITQADVDRSINAIRDRPLDAGAQTKGVEKTAHLQLASLPNDPERDADVSSLIWEIRRERRMEFVFENHRLLDLKRWNKIQYMDFDKGNDDDHLFGPWVNLEVELPDVLDDASIGNVRVKHADGSIVTWDGDNESEMIGYWMVENVQNRNSFDNKIYLSPIGLTQINDYKNRGYELTQTPGWE